MSDDLTDVIGAPVDKIVEALTSFETFPQWQASVMECEVLERDEENRGSLIRMKVDGKVKKLDTVVRYAYDLPNTLSWEQTSGDFKEYVGKYSFTPRADGGTDVTVDIVAEVGFFVPGPMKKLIKDQSLKNAMRELRKRVEG
jgi:ribosome-associated toxin RatA of RatAB toxin-antitoxin module